MRAEQSGTPARQFIDYLGTVPASSSLLKNKTEVLNWRKDFLSVGTCVSICPKGRSYKVVHGGAFEICKKRGRVLAAVCRWVCQGGGLQMGLQQHCMSGGGAPMGLQTRGEPPASEPISTATLYLSGFPLHP